VPQAAGLELAKGERVRIVSVQVTYTDRGEPEGVEVVVDALGHSGPMTVRFEPAGPHGWSPAVDTFQTRRLLSRVKELGEAMAKDRIRSWST
jgi:hypothetical protein